MLRIKTLMGTVSSIGDFDTEGGLSSANNVPRESDSSEFIRLFESAKNGSKEQQAELLDSFRDYLRVLAAKTIGPDANGKLSVSDLVQSAIIDACNGFDHCRASGRHEFKSWLRQILMNDILNRYRYLRRQKRDMNKEVALEGDRLVAATDSPVAEAQRKEEEQRLDDAIEKLRPDQQLVIRMRHQEKLTFTEIGKRMDRSADAIRMLWNRAIEDLAKKL